VKQTYFLIKLLGRNRRGYTAWLYITEVKQSAPYRVESIKYSPSKGMAKLMGKLEAEKLAESLRGWRRRPYEVLVEAAK
jgi:hypothetical protein